MQLGMALLWLIGLGFLFAMYAFNSYVLRLSGRYSSAAGRRWSKIGAVLGILFLFLLYGIDEKVASGRLSDPSAVILTCSIVVVLGLTLIWVISRGLREADEFVRKVELEALVLTAAGALLGILVLTILSNAEVRREVRVRDLVYLTVVPHVVARLLLAWRYRA